MNDDADIISVTLVDGNLEVVKRYKSNTILACNPAPDRIVREVYKATGSGHNAIYLDRSIEGHHIPSPIVSETIKV